MKNKKGFTLVELLAVIVILGVLLMIAVPAVQNVIKKAKNNATQKQAELFIDAAKKMAIIDEATSDMVIYKLSDLDSSVDKNRFTGMVVALKENGSYKYYHPQLQLHFPLQSNKYLECYCYCYNYMYYYLP